MVSLSGAGPFGDQQRDFKTAPEEYKALQNSLADFLEGHMNLAVMYTDQNWLDRAEAEFQQAIKIAPQFVPARINLANLWRVGMTVGSDSEPS